MIEKHIRKNAMSRLVAGAQFAGILFAAVAGAGSTALYAQAKPQQQYPVPGGGFGTGIPLQLPPMPVSTPITPNGTVVEDVIARVNDQIITRSEYLRSEQQLLQEAQQRNMSPSEFEDSRKNLLRDMIDQQLLLSKGKELGITGDAETMRELDDIRKKNHLDSIEDLEKAAAQQGVSFEDFKQGIRNQAITQQVVQEEVSRHINMTHAQDEAYYNAHSKDFEIPEQVHLSEILVPTPDNATDAQVAAAQAKADDLEAKLKAGTSFSDLAKSSSGGPTAAAGGDLGDFKHGALGDVLENATFPLPQGGFTAPIRTRQGFVILRVDKHQAAGVPPLADIEPQVQNAIYLDELQPALRAYLTKARENAYYEVRPGFVDTGSVHAGSRPGDIGYTAYAPPPPKKKTIKHQRAEQQKAAAAQAQLAAARAKVAQRNAERAAAQAAKSPGTRNTSKAVKPPKVRREKIRYGQAPRNSLPTSPVETTATESAPLAGQAPGVAMAATESSTTISTGTGVDENADPLAAQTAPTHKTRFSSRQKEEDEQRDKAKLAKADLKASVRPIKADAQSSASEQHQAGPLGLNGDTVKKVKKKRKKGDPKERLQEKPKPVDTTQPVAPTVNPALGGSPSASLPPAQPATTPAAPSDTTNTPATPH
jgi:peptidyl-prolyl cis-trans isomerase SurA